MKKGLKRIKRRFVGLGWAPVGYFATALFAWPVLIDLEPLDRFHDLSRGQGSRVLDNVGLLIFTLSIALVCTLLHDTVRVRRLARARALDRRRAKVYARHDPLTGLFNRRAFMAALEREGKSETREAGRAVGIIDFDRFTLVNDLYGPAAGDATLCRTARRLKQEIAGEGLVARLGGDKFALIFKKATDHYQVEQHCRRLLARIAEPYDHCGRTISIGGTIGLATWGADIAGRDALHQADKALAQAKKHDRGGFVWYDADADRKALERAELEADLRGAIRAREVQPWFQPIVRIDSGELIGFEVLARWTHPVRGPVPPCDFITIAEDKGMIGTLGGQLLRRACEIAKFWDPALSISFNISAVQFQDSGLVAQIEGALMECGFDPARLILEVGENAVIRDFEATRETLAGLRAMGVRVAVDDFGTGYSSLSSLRQLPFDRIKIDRSFVTDIATEPQNQKIVAGILALAKGLELDVTAAGVETGADLDYFKDRDCTLAQGYLFEKALPGDEIDWLLETRWADRHVAPIEDGQGDATGLSSAG